MLHHHREGRGPPLVLLHGVGHHWQGWRPVIARLADAFDVVAVDLPGFGRSAPLPAGVEPTIPAFADALVPLLGELGLERPHVAGNSMGGAIGLELARRRAAASVSAFSPAGFWTPRERAFCQRSLGTLAAVPPVARPALLALAGTTAGRVALFWQTHDRPRRLPADEARSTLADAWASPALVPALAAFHRYTFGAPDELRGVPITVAWGNHDRLLLFRRQAPRARRLLPWARHVTLGAGHVPFADDPGAVAAVVRGTAGQPSSASAAESRRGDSNPRPLHYE